MCTESLTMPMSVNYIAQHFGGEKSKSRASYLSYMPNNSEAVKLTLIVGGAALVLLFAGQVFQFAARWAGRAISGALLLLLAAGIGYATYQLMSGWTAAGTTSNSSSDTETSDFLSDTDSIDPGGDSESQDGPTMNEELEDELDGLLDADQDQTDEVTDTN